MLAAGQGTDSGAGLYRIMLAQEVAQAMKEDGKIWFSPSGDSSSPSGLVVQACNGSTGVWLRPQGSFRVPNQPELHSQPHLKKDLCVSCIHPLTGFLLPLLILVARELELSGEEFNSSSNY